MSQLIIQITEAAGGETRELEFNQREILIGRGKDCDIQLRGWRVGREHANPGVSTSSPACVRPNPAPTQRGR